MSYTPTDAGTFRSKGGSLSQKLGYEFSNIATEFNGGLKVATGALIAGSANAFAFAWQNPETSKIIINRVFVNVTTKSATAGSLLDVGTGATATTHSDNLIDGLDIATATVLADNVKNAGTNGKGLSLLDEKSGTTSYVTGQILVQNAAALAGKYYIVYMVV